MGNPFALDDSLLSWLGKSIKFTHRLQEAALTRFASEKSGLSECGITINSGAVVSKRLPFD